MKFKIFTTVHNLMNNRNMRYRGSYMSAHVLLNEFGKIDKMQGLRSILSLFRNKFI